MSVVEIAPVVKTLEIKRSAQDTFRMYVHEAAKWWPLETHAISPEHGTRAVDHVVEPRVGGRIYEIAEDGRTFDLGEVLIYEPGRRFAMSWQLGQPRDVSGEVEVRFDPVSDNSCRLTLTHSGWERMGDKGREMREGYNQGWESVLGQTFMDYVRKG